MPLLDYNKFDVCYCFIIIKNTQNHILYFVIFLDCFDVFVK